MRHIALLLSILCLYGCSSKDGIHTEFKTHSCISPRIAYTYVTCDAIKFEIDGKSFVIPADFETDLASIPRIIWPILSPFHSSLIRPAIVHDWFYRMSCEYNRHETDLIFYHMLKNEGVSTIKASIMYYGVRLFGWNYYNEESCYDEFIRLDQES